MAMYLITIADGETAPAGKRNCLATLQLTSSAGKSGAAIGEHKGAVGSAAAVRGG